MVNVLSYFVDQNSLTQSDDQKPLAKNKTNVILIVLDAVRSDHLHCYGYHKKTSPFLDRLASEGVFFSTAIAQSSHTQESVPSLLSSTYPSTHRIKHNVSRLPEDLVTLPMVYKRNGYKTAVFSTIPYVSSIFGYDRGVDLFFENQKAIIQDTILFLFLEKIILNIANQRTFFKLIRNSASFFKTKNILVKTDAKYVMEQAISWLKNNHSDPFFLYLHLEGGHMPYKSPPPYNKKFVPNPDFSKEISDPYMLSGYTEKNSPDPSELAHMIAQYNGKILFHDQNLPILFNTIKSLGLENKTVIVITSDHGEEFYDHKGFMHSETLYSEVINVPLILYGPGILPRGKKIDNPVALVDIFPTLLNLCDIKKIKLPYPIVGSDLTPLWTGKGEYSRNYVFSELNRVFFSKYAVMNSNFKLILTAAGEKETFEIYNLKTDPGEKTNSVDKYPEIKIAFEDLLKKIIKESSLKALSPKKVKLDEEMKKKLKSLGYLQ
jgi:arylsulfatase A-like enzyme